MENNVPTPDGQFDIIIVGAGPAGSSCALSLSGMEIKVLLIDRAKFPRDKICGDALSLDVINQLPKLSEKLLLDFERCPMKMPSSGVRLFSPDLTCIDLPFVHKGERRNGYVLARQDFDNILFEAIKESANICIKENCELHGVKPIHNGVQVFTNQGNYKAKMIVGADGANSVVNQLAGKKAIDRDHHSAGLRVYYQDVHHFHNENFVELYFFNDILPGYLWVFPMRENKANVGIGMLSSLVSKKRINLKETLKSLLTTHPVLKERFKDARPLENVKGHGLPLGSKRRKISGERFLLAGDAAGLIDPFTGEGIGNAIRSGRVAAEHIKQCFVNNDFSARFNKSYENEVYMRMQKEFRMSGILQKLCRYPILFNHIFHKAKANPYWHNFLTLALSDVDQKKQFVNPLFYYRLIMG